MLEPDYDDDSTQLHHTEVHINATITSEGRIDGAVIHCTSLYCCSRPFDNDAIPGELVVPIINLLFKDNFTMPYFSPRLNYSAVIYFVYLLTDVRRL